MEEFLQHALADYDISHLFRHIAIYFLLFFIPVFACSADLGSGILAAKKLGEPLQSHRLRKTIEKIIVYWLFEGLAFFAELLGTLFPQYSLPFVGILCALAIACIEGRSMVENARKMKHGLGDVPGTIQGFTHVLGETEVKKILADAAKKRLEKQLNVTDAQ